MLATIQNSGMFGNVQGFSPSKQIVIGHESLSSILCAGRVPSVHARARATAWVWVWYDRFPHSGTPLLQVAHAIYAKLMRYLQDDFPGFHLPYKIQMANLIFPSPFLR